jgi:hypothetical protein
MNGLVLGWQVGPKIEHSTTGLVYFIDADRIRDCLKKIMFT